MRPKRASFAAVYVAPLIGWCARTRPSTGFTRLLAVSGSRTGRRTNALSNRKTIESPATGGCATINRRLMKTDSTQYTRARSFSATPFVPSRSNISSRSPSSSNRSTSNQNCRASIPRILRTLDARGPRRRSLIACQIALIAAGSPQFGRRPMPHRLSPSASERRLPAWAASPTL